MGRVNFFSLMKKILAYALPALALGLVIGVPGAHAQEAFGTSTAVQTVNDFRDAIAVIVGAVIGGILTLMAGLLGLGWGTRKVRQHITGRKF